VFARTNKVLLIRGFKFEVQRLTLRIPDWVSGIYKANARIVHGWVEHVGLDTTCYGTHTLRRTKPTLIYKRAKYLTAVQLLLGHSKIESTVRYLGIEVDDALEMAEQTEV
jgi:integrase